MVGNSCVVFLLFHLVRHSSILTLDIQAHQTVHYFDRAQCVTSRARLSPIVLIAACYLALLYYDYALTFGRECTLFWSLNSFKRWGSILFFLNRYCGVIGHTLVFVEIFIRPDSDLCTHLHGYHQFLAIAMQSIVAGMSPCSPYYAHSRESSSLSIIKQ